MSKDWEEKFRPEDLQRIRGFRLMDDDFMSKCFEENIECTELVLQIVLGRDDLKVEKVAIQHQLKNLQGRSIIFDIYATDHAGKRYGKPQGFFWSWSMRYWTWANWNQVRSCWNPDHSR